MQGRELPVEGGRHREHTHDGGHPEGGFQREVGVDREERPDRRSEAHGNRRQRITLGYDVQWLGVRRSGLIARSARTVVPKRIAIVARESPWDKVHDSGFCPGIGSRVQDVRGWSRSGTGFRGQGVRG
jgi:hypothetical protein